MHELYWIALALAGIIGGGTVIVTTVIVALHAAADRLESRDR